jgi:DNA-directed RNA polymerase subunit RPC12/RpoP
MQKRECSDCGGDLVLAVRGNQAPTNQSPSLVTSAITSWRCSTCGSAFSAAQLRLNKRERLKATARA